MLASSLGRAASHQLGNNNLPSQRHQVFRRRSRKHQRKSSIKDASSRIYQELVADANPDAALPCKPRSTAKSYARIRGMQHNKLRTNVSQSGNQRSYIDAVEGGLATPKIEATDEERAALDTAIELANEVTNTFLITAESSSPRKGSSYNNISIDSGAFDGTSLGERTPAPIQLRTRASRTLPLVELVTPRKNASREDSADDSGWLSEGKLILRRVGSFNRKKSANVHQQKPQKLDLKLYERFEGQYLVNWATSGLSKHLKSQISDVDLKAIGTAFCSLLVSAGILKTHSDKEEAEPHVDDTFRMEHMYYWTPKDISEIMPKETVEESKASSEKIQISMSHKAQMESKAVQTDSPSDPLVKCKAGNANSTLLRSHDKGEDAVSIKSLDSGGWCTASSLDISSILWEETRSFTGSENSSNEACKAPDKRAFKSENDSKEMIASSPPPPPPPPPPPMASSLLLPPIGGSRNWISPSRAPMRKPLIHPEIPMKPLYWTRIILPMKLTATDSSSSIPDSTVKGSLWLEIQEPNVNLKEFAELFSRQVSKRKPAAKTSASRPLKIKPTTILDSARSKKVGILEKSLRVDFVELEKAVYNLDTSAVSFEALEQIYNVRPTSRELADILAHEKNQPDQPLDSPEIFLKKLSSIQFLQERLGCLIFQTEFADAMSSISSKITNLLSVCEFMLGSTSLKDVMALILTLGNYMNGGSVIRGQADGFSLEILGKLKDVKSKLTGMTLLHYVVKTKLLQENSTNAYKEPLPLPVPEPASVQAAAAFDFQDIAKELEILRVRVQDCIEKCTIVKEGNPKNAGPFKIKMDAFLARAHKELIGEADALQKTRTKFKSTMEFYHYVPKGLALDTAQPKDFFIAWLSFCRDFKEIWQKEFKAQRSIETVKKKYGN